MPAPTIKHHLREGVLPEPVKTSRNMAHYPPEFIDRRTPSGPGRWSSWRIGSSTALSSASTLIAALHTKLMVAELERHRARRS